MKDLYEKIEQYLTDELSAEERTSFEQAMAKDADLAAEVQLHQKMASVFEDPQAFQLREQLQQAGDSFQWPEEKKTNTKSSNIRYLYWASAAAAILAGIIFFFSTPQEDTPPPITDQITPPSIDTLITSPNTENLAQERPSDQNSNEIQEPDQNPAPDSPTPPDNPPIIDIPLDLLAANPAMEELIQRFEPSKEYDFELEVQITQTDAESQFFLLGEVYTAELPSDGLFHLTVYDNQAENYPSNPIISTILSPTKAEDDDQPLAFAAKEAYGLLFVENLPVYPAKYYYVISAKETEQPVAVGMVE